MRLVIRGSGPWWIVRYLRLSGGRRQAPDRVAGPGWTAALITGTYAIHGMTFPEVTVDLDGDPEAVAAVARSLKRMAMRGGG